MEVKNSDVKNKRKFVRNNFIHNFTVIDQDTNEEVGDLADITMQGVMLICDHKLETDHNYNLEFAPDDHIMDGQKIIFNARAIRCLETEIHEMYSIGFIINEIDQSSKDNLNSLINEFGLDCKLLK